VKGVEELMPAVLANKIRTGLVELRTDIGLVYVNPGSSWQRLYLLWTFRHFRLLPKQVLNHHQQQLIDELCRSAIVSPSEPVAATSIIGVIENVHLMSVPAALRPTADGYAPVPVGALSASVPVRELRRRARATGTSVAQLLTSNVGVRPAPARVQSIRAEELVVSPAEHAQEKEAKAMMDSIPGSRYRWLPATLVMASALLAVGGWLLYAIPGVRSDEIGLPPLLTSVAPAVSSSMEAVGSPQSAVQESAPSPNSEPNTVQQPLPAPVSSESQAKSVMAEAAPVAVRPPAPPEVPKRRKQVQGPQKKISVTHTSTVPSKASLEEVALPTTDNVERGLQRPQVSGTPIDFKYPFTSKSKLTGKVNLQAVVGVDGKVTQVKVLSGNRHLARLAVEAVRHWRYRPQQFQGQAVESEANIAISFGGDDAVSVSFSGSR
jgi:TonB family protein